MSESIGAAPFDWRPMSARNLGDVARVAARVHPDYPERIEVFAERLRLYPAGNLVLHDAAGRIVGYLISHPWAFGSVPALDSLLGALPAQRENYYIHDIALLPEARGRGAARAAVELSIGLAKAEGFARVSLVAIAGTQAFWERQGFNPVDDRPELAVKLASYDGAARYMSRRL